MQCSTSDNDCATYIDVNAISMKLKSKHELLPVALPALHALTGCNYTAAFNRKGKVKGLQLLEEDENGSVIKAFARLTSVNSDIEMEPFENFVCNLYGFKGKTQSVNEARLMKLHQQAGRFDCKKKKS